MVIVGLSGASGLYNSWLSRPTDSAMRSGQPGPQNGDFTFVYIWEC